MLICVYELFFGVICRDELSFIDWQFHSKHQTFNRSQIWNHNDLVIDFQTDQGFQSRGVFVEIVAKDDSVARAVRTDDMRQSNDAIEGSKASSINIVLNPTIQLG